MNEIFRLTSLEERKEADFISLKLIEVADKIKNFYNLKF
jgi:hypothetical protein